MHNILQYYTHKSSDQHFTSVIFGAACIPLTKTSTKTDTFTVSMHV